MPNTVKISKAYDLEFPVSTVFAAWVSSDTVIAPATGMDVRPEVGGHYRLLMENEGGSARAEGVFSIVEENRHLRYSWGWVGFEEMTEIDVRFSPAGGGTRIDLVHRGFTSEESRGMHDAGWDSYVNGLRAFLGGKRA